MLIEKDLTISIPHRDACDVSPRGPQALCEPMHQHSFFAKIEAAGFKYEICGRCGAVRITELTS